MSNINSISTTYEEEIIVKECMKNEKYISEKDEIFCPWIKQDSKSHSSTGILKLHYEILDFYNFIKLNDQEKKLRIKTYNYIKNFLNQNFPEYICELYGSFRTGLSLPNSDIDILIQQREDKKENTQKIENHTLLYNSLKEIYNQLEEKKDFTYLELIIAKVPIIKCTYKETNINVDISIYKKNGTVAAKQFEKIIKIHPEIRPLMLTIKYMLRQKGLNEVYKGGVSSFMIFSLLFYFISDTKKIINNNIKKGQKEEYLSLGHLLKNILSLENFQDISQDMGKSCYLYSKVIDAFKYASKHLTCINSPVISYLSGFILPDDLLKERAY